MSQFFLYLFSVNAPATTDFYTLSLHDALPIAPGGAPGRTRRSRPTGPVPGTWTSRTPPGRSEEHTSDLQSVKISYAVFCLKKKTTLSSNVLACPIVMH